jgi:hypothetical protein
MKTEGIRSHSCKWLILCAALLLCAGARAQQTLPLPASASFADGMAEAASSAALAQNPQSLSTVKIPATLPADVKPAEEYPSRRKWIALSIVQHSAAFFDSYSTRQAIGSGAVEEDPLMRPFAKTPAIYAAIQVGPVILDYAARKMQRSENNFIRHMWWMPQSTATAMYLFSGVHNMHVAGRM